MNGDRSDKQTRVSRNAGESLDASHSISDLQP